MKWHNDRAPWAERKDRHRKNALKKAAYHADPEFWRNRTRKWRADHPEQATIFAERQKRGYWVSPWRKMVINAKARAKKYSIPFDLTFEWAEKRWTGFCELTGLPFSPQHDNSACSLSPSLDRIYSEKGYTQDNCRFILYGVNGLKHAGTDEAMYAIAEALLNYRTHPSVASERSPL